MTWSLVAIEGSQGVSVLELRRADSGEVVAAVASDGSDVPVVSGYAFGEGEPTDAVVPGTKTVYAQAGPHTPLYALKADFLSSLPKTPNELTAAK